jgi:transposase
LPVDHLAWFVIDAVASMDLVGFYAAYRADGHGRAAYEPSMMVALLMYSYATDVRSSRAMERHCRQDVAYRVITGNVVPDHSTIARFVVRHEVELAELFGEVLRLCDQAGLVQAGVIAIDGTRLAGNASQEVEVGFEQIAREILAEAKLIDAAEDERYGDARGDELREELRTAEGRREFFRQARERLTDKDSGGEDGDAALDENGYAFDPELVTRRRGRRAWEREAQRQLEQRRWDEPDRIARGRPERLLLAAERLEADHAAEVAANEAYDHYRATGRDSWGRRLGRPPSSYEPPALPAGKVNLTDPDSQRMKSHRVWVQGYNAQAVVGEGQIVLAAEITTSSTDWSQLDPMVSAMVNELAQAGISDRPEVALADAQYWQEDHIDEVITNKHIQVLIPPDSRGRAQPRPGWQGGRYDWMRQVLGSGTGQQLYRKRIHMIEPVFGHAKHNRKFLCFHRRGRTAARTEWRLLMATQNLTKLHRHQIATATA